MRRLFASSQTSLVRSTLPLASDQLYTRRLILRLSLVGHELEAPWARTRISLLSLLLHTSKASLASALATSPSRPSLSTSLVADPSRMARTATSHTARTLPTLVTCSSITSSLLKRLLLLVLARSCHTTRVPSVPS